ncbi:Holliday junction resolvase RuvX [Arthrobacter sp. TWP1-1]|uniref:Holliday junction resolvase RuvX n=1 Tax=Arthrobacter sp. TWP1-1 TaxID=2804568 RepID=UPI003CE9AFA9
MTERNFPQGVKLGVDVGMVRVGLATCDPDGILATPVKTLSRDLKKNSDVKVVVKEAAARGAVQIFVGLPRTMKGEEKASAEMARSYAGILVSALEQASMDVPVHLIDERLTTVSAHQALHKAGVSSREHRKVVDQVAAVEILQHAIDMQKARNANVGQAVRTTGPGVVGTAGTPEHEEDSTISTQIGVPEESTQAP